MSHRTHFTAGSVQFKVYLQRRSGCSWTILSEACSAVGIGELNVFATWERGERDGRV